MLNGETRHLEAQFRCYGPGERALGQDEEPEALSAAVGDRENATQEGASVLVDRLSGFLVRRN